MERVSKKPTPHAVVCKSCGQQFLTYTYYMYLLSRPDDPWVCPVCGEDAIWDDDNYERYLDDDDGCLDGDGWE